MEYGRNAMKPRWYGSLVKENFIHPPDQQDKISKALSIQYKGVAFECSKKVYHWSEHLHDSLEILFIKKGAYMGRINGQEVKLTAGDVLIAGPGDLHSDLCRPPLEYYAIWFDIRQVAGGRQIHLLRNNLVPAKHVHSLKDKVILKRLEALLLEEKRNSRFALSLQQAMAEEIIWRLLGDLPEDVLNPLLVKRNRESELLIRLTDLFWKNVRTPMTVRAIAGALNMSESALAHECTPLLGRSPGKLFAMYRLAQAEQMLLRGKMTVKEIAAELGFHDESHFIHSFRREHSTSPGKFRDSVSGSAAPQLSSRAGRSAADKAG